MCKRISRTLCSMVVDGDEGALQEFPCSAVNGDDNAIISQSITVKRCFMGCPLYESIAAEEE